MDSLEAQLREEFANPPAVDHPPASVLIASTNRIQRRRRVVTGLAATVVVAAVVTASAVTVSAQTRSPRTVGPTHPRPSATSSAVASLNTAINMGYAAPANGRFVDATHGFVEIIRCGNAESDDCSLVLLATDDGGATFTPRTLPTSATSARLYVFDTSHLVLDDSDKAVTTVGKRWISSDGGRTWTSVPGRAQGTATSIPPGAQLFASMSVTKGKKITSPVFALTADGHAIGLPGVPHAGLTLLALNAVAESTGEIDGTYLTSDSDGHGKVRLWVSHDQGTTWAQSTLPAPAGGLDVLGGADHRLFMVVYPDSGGAPVLTASSDGGRTWQPIDSPMNTLPDKGSPESLDGSFAVLPNGGVLLAVHNHLWLLAPGGSTFAPDDGGTITYSVTGLGGAATALRGPKSHAALYTTTDGIRWKRATLH